jgi:signal transduction histidine kinase
MDEKLLYYLFINLLSNAAKYSPSGSQIILELYSDVINKVAIFKVIDQGIGIPESDQKQIFDSFYRATNVESFHGNGLGLVIARKCVEAHNGKIEVDSKLGVGTTFTVTLPLNSKQ